ncbi:MAG TPA: fibrillarin-like rRNA/tRNA 2'-O-methyltransferase [Thermoplasmata archaeon]|nr:fibrillarin-like rRNA/tRNA 2'-O-methyltransferase [Thermoplasmata archaeon]
MKRVGFDLVDPTTPRLLRRRLAERDAYWTASAAADAPVYGERVLHRGREIYRSFEPGRSKLAAAIAKGWKGPFPGPGEFWLYLGAAGGTTASHVADLVGPGGGVFAIEKSVRPFVRLLRVAERYPNLYPVLGDVRRWEEYDGLVAPVDGLYADLAAPDQVRLVEENARAFLRPRGRLLLALKTASMGRERSPEEHRLEAFGRLGRSFELRAGVNLEPFHKRHYFVGGQLRPSGGLGAEPARDRNLFRSPRRERRVGPRVRATRATR